MAGPQQANASTALALSGRQEAILQALLHYGISNAGSMPSIRRIQDMANISSTCVVAYNLRKLAGKGLIELVPGGRGHLVVIPGATWTPPAHLAHLVATGEAAAA